MMWFFIVFTMIHVYLVFYHDYVEGRGVISSMAGGWKFIPRRQPRSQENSPPAEQAETPKNVAVGANAESKEGESASQNPTEGPA